jgi:hypothetical protein
VASAVRPTSDSEAAGRELVEKAVASMGGAKVVDGVRSLDMHGKAKRIFPSGEEVSLTIATAILFPDFYRQEVELPAVKLVTVLGPDGAYTDMGDGPVLLPDEQTSEMRQSYQRNLLTLLRARGKAGFHAIAKKTDTQPAGTAQEVEVQAEGIEATLAIEKSSGRITRMVFQGGMPRKENVTEYSDWRTVSGLTYPFATTTSAAGKPANSVQLESLVVDAPLDPALFHPQSAPVRADAQDAAAPGSEATPAPVPTPHGRV